MANANENQQEQLNDGEREEEYFNEVEMPGEDESEDEFEDECINEEDSNTNKNIKRANSFQTPKEEKNNHFEEVYINNGEPKRRNSSKNLSLDYKGSSGPILKAFLEDKKTENNIVSPVNVANEVHSSSLFYPGSNDPKDDFNELQSLRRDEPILPNDEIAFFERNEDMIRTVNGHPRRNSPSDSDENSPSYTVGIDLSDIEENNHRNQNQRRRRNGHRNENRRRIINIETNTYYHTTDRFISIKRRRNSGGR